MAWKRDERKLDRAGWLPGAEMELWEAWLQQEQAEAPGMLLLLEWLGLSGAAAERERTLQWLAAFLLRSFRSTDLLIRMEDGRFFLAFAEIESPRTFLPRLEQLLFRAVRECPYAGGNLRCAAGGAAYPEAVQEFGVIYRQAEARLSHAMENTGGLVQIECRMAAE